MNIYKIFRYFYCYYMMLVFFAIGCIGLAGIITFLGKYAGHTMDFRVVFWDTVVFTAIKVLAFIIPAYLVFYFLNRNNQYVNEVFGTEDEQECSSSSSDES